MNSYDALMAALEDWDGYDEPGSAMRLKAAYQAHREAEGIWLERVEMPAGKSYAFRELHDTEYGPYKYKGKLYRLPQEVDDETL